jgi:membrane-associated phospholipid phosphatase
MKEEAMEEETREEVKKGAATVALFSAQVIVLGLLLLAALLVFILVARQVFVKGGTPFDREVFAWLAPYVNERNNRIVHAFTQLGSSRFLLPAHAVLVIYYAFIRRHRWYSIKIPVIGLSSLGLMSALKHLFNRPRPDIPLLYEASGLSFPSGHALTGVTFFGLLIYLIYNSAWRPWIKWIVIPLLVLLTLFIGFTRVYLRVHYPTDVIAGFCVGLLWLAASLWLLGRMERFSRRRVAPELTGD